MNENARMAELNVFSTLQFVFAFNGYPSTGKLSISNSLHVVKEADPKKFQRGSNGCLLQTKGCAGRDKTMLLLESFTNSRKVLKSVLSRASLLSATCLITTAVLETPRRLAIGELVVLRRNS